MSKIKNLYQDWLAKGKPVPEEIVDETEVKIDPLTEKEIEEYINKIIINTPFFENPYVAILVSDATHNPVDFNNPNGNVRENYDYVLEREYVEGETFYITAIEALLFTDYFGRMNVRVKNRKILPLKYFVFRDYGIVVDKKILKNQIEWNVQDFYQQFGLP